MKRRSRMLSLNSTGTTLARYIFRIRAWPRYGSMESLEPPMRKRLSACCATDSASRRAMPKSEWCCQAINRGRAMRDFSGSFVTIPNGTSKVLTADRGGDDETRLGEHRRGCDREHDITGGAGAVRSETRDSRRRAHPRPQV